MSYTTCTTLYQCYYNPLTNSTEQVPLLMRGHIAAVRAHLVRVVVTVHWFRTRGVVEEDRAARCGSYYQGVVVTYTHPRQHSWGGG